MPDEISQQTQNDPSGPEFRGRRFAALIRQWEREGRRGFKAIRAGVTSALHEVFTEQELLRLRRRLSKIEWQLSQVYSTLGEDVATAWARGTEETLPDEIRTKYLDELRPLQEARREILRQMQEWET
jgi:hypothetical protein